MKIVGVIGAGQMGAGIAQIAVQAGIRVLLSDVSQDVAEKGKADIAAQLAKAVERGKLDAAAQEAAASLLVAVADLEPMPEQPADEAPKPKHRVGRGTLEETRRALA